jgi:hypothetical protein
MATLMLTGKMHHDDVSSASLFVGMAAAHANAEEGLSDEDACVKQIGQLTARSLLYFVNLCLT